MEKWMHMGVSGQVGWPRKRSEVDFGGHKLVLMPRTKTNSASVHIEISNLDDVTAMTTINRFLSQLSWCEGQPLINHYGWSGNPKPVPVPAPRISSSTTDFFAFARQPLADEKQRLAVALYREGKNLDSIPYEFLSYFKILNIVWNDRKKKGKNELVEGLSRTLPKITDKRCKERLEVIAEEHDDPSYYLYKSGRCAVAHAYSKPLVDPDDVAHLRRLSEDIDVVRAIVEHLMENELGISRCRWADAPND